MRVLPIAFALVLGSSTLVIADEPLSVQDAQQRLAERQKAATTQPDIQTLSIRVARLQTENDALKKQVADLQKQLSKATAPETAIRNGMKLSDAVAFAKSKPVLRGESGGISQYDLSVISQGADYRLEVDKTETVVRWRLLGNSITHDIAPVAPNPIRMNR